MKLTGTILVFIASMVVPVNAYCQKCDTILWSKHHYLKWKNFKSIPDRRNAADALSDISIFYQITTAQSFAKITVACYFYPCGSWVKVAASSRLLQHEQTHFDIAEYHKRLLMKEIMNHQYTISNINTSVDEFGKMITNLRAMMDNEYDLETAHSVNEDKQREWSKKIDKLLKKLNVYAGNSYILTLN